MGGRNGNFNQIKQTSDNPLNPLVEKIKNSEDSYLEQACYDNKINPLGKDAPKSPKEALFKCKHS